MLKHTRHSCRPSVWQVREAFRGLFHPHRAGSARAPRRASDSRRIRMDSVLALTIVAKNEQLQDEQHYGSPLGLISYLLLQWNDETSLVIPFGVCGLAYVLCFLESDIHVSETTE